MYLLILMQFFFFSFLAVVAHHPKSDEYFSDPRLAAYAVPYSQVVPGYTVIVQSCLFLVN